MIQQRDLEPIKKLASLFTCSISGGAMFLITDCEKVIHCTSSDEFNIPAFREGAAFSPGGAVTKAIQGKQVIIDNLPQSLYGIRIRVVAQPVYYDNADDVCGALAIVYPLQHPLIGAFEIFAPAIATLFPGGSIVYVSDWQKILKYQPAPTFDFEKARVGTSLNDKSNAVISMEQNRVLARSCVINNTPVLEMNYPICDDEGAIIGSLGLIMLKTHAEEIRTHSETLATNMLQISDAIEHLALNATNIAAAQGNLNNGIHQISQVSGSIETVVEFIKSIAEETKMLGLNAAIEAARAGDAGRGFGVVADEIRKLSSESKDTTAQIKALLDEVGSAVRQITSDSVKSLQSAEEQAAGIQEISASVQDLNALSSQLALIAGQL